MPVGVAVGVGVWVLVEVGVGVGVWVPVDVGVAVGVLVGVGVGVGKEEPYSSAPMSKQPSQGQGRTWPSMSSVTPAFTPASRAALSGPI